VFSLKKLFIAILIFVILFAQVNAVVVTDISEQIQSGNQNILQANAQMTAQIASLNVAMQNLSTQLVDLKASSVAKSDLPEIYGTIQQLNRDANGQQLATLLAVVVCVFALLFLSKAKGWL
jgi:predicted PurR-regulated permease PerM